MILCRFFFVQYFYFHYFLFLLQSRVSQLIKSLKRQRKCREMFDSIELVLCQISLWLSGERNSRIEVDTADFHLAESLCAEVCGQRAQQKQLVLDCSCC